MITESEYNGYLRDYKDKRKELHEKHYEENKSLRDMHPDSLSVDYFADRMKEKLQDKRNEGKQGWHDPNQCSLKYLSKLLKEHIEKGDPVDVANFCMMIYMRGGKIE